MDNLVPGIRNAVRALIVRERQILLLRKEGGGQPERYALPGGGQDLGETLHDAVIRECVEEIGSEVTVGELLHVADFFKLRPTEPPSTRHLVEFLFRCQIADDYRPHSGHHPDKHQVEVVWMPLAKLSETPLFPRSMGDYLAQLDSRPAPTYLGIFDQ